MYYRQRTKKYKRKVKTMNDRDGLQMTISIHRQESKL